MIGFICLALLFLVATTTLPMALAPSAPTLARVLNPHDPLVLQGLAQEARSAYRIAEGQQDTPAADSDVAPAVPSAPGTADAPFDTIAQLPEATPSFDIAPRSSAPAPQAQLERETVREWATALIAVDPLNAVPFRMLAEVADDPDEQRRLMLEAAKRSRRDIETIVWLLQDDLDTGRFEVALGRAELLVRTRPRLQERVFTALAPLAENTEARPALVQWLARSPQWRESFFRSVTRGITNADTPFLIMQELQELGEQPVEEEIQEYLRFLLSRKFADYAYNVWVQTQPAERLKEAGFVNDPRFQREPNTGPFDWTISTPRNAVGEFTALPDLGGQRAFHVAFGAGRVRFPQLSQIIVLPPGHYRLEGKLRGTLIGKRGLIWQVACLYRPNPPLAETEQLLGQSRTWRMFDFDFEVPADPECPAQTLRLLHDSRSASEEMISGEAWFIDIGIQRNFPSSEEGQE